MQNGPPNLIKGYGQILKSTGRYTTQNVRAIWKDFAFVHPLLLSSVDFHTEYGRRVVLATKEVTMGTKVSKPPATLGATWEL